MTGMPWRDLYDSIQKGDLLQPLKTLGNSKNKYLFFPFFVFYSQGNQLIQAGLGGIWHLKINKKTDTEVTLTETPDTAELMYSM